MDDRSSMDRVVPVHNLRDFFRTSIDDAMANQGVELEPQAAHYVVNLLTIFSRSEEFYEDDGETYGLRPLALMLADAVDATNPQQRNYSLQRIGDVALFTSGFFLESLENRAVDVDYYIYMGENAYGSLSSEVKGTFRGNAFAGVYQELSAKFQKLVDVLNEIRDGGRDSNIDIMRTYEVWLKTGSARAKKQLRENGIEPLTDLVGKKQH